jgi:hypothetical protein
VFRRRLISSFPAVLMLAAQKGGAASRCALLET